MKLDISATGPTYFACGGLAYYLRYGNDWQGNELRLVYNVLFGTLNLIGWCLEWLWPYGAQFFWALVFGAGIITAILLFLWTCHLPPFQRIRRWF